MKIKQLTLVLTITSLTLAQSNIIIPDTLAGPDYSLTLQNATFEFSPGIVSPTMGVNGPVLGPTLIMNKHENVNLLVENQLGEETTIHWHGMHVSADNDGGPHTVISPGDTWNPQFSVLDNAGTYWYHPHLHEHTDEHVSKGIAGFIIVRDAEEAALSLPRTYGVDDFPLVIQTKSIDPSGQIISHTNSDTILMVNATRDPVLDVPAQVVRFRLLNGSSQRVFNIGFTGNRSFHAIASDGGLLNNSLELTRLLLAPGERAEILFNFTEVLADSVALMSFASEIPNGIYGANQPGMMSMQTLNGYNPNPLNGADFEIMLFRIESSTENPILSIPTSLTTVTPFEENSADTIRNFTLSPESMGPNAINGDFMINGSFFNMNVINEIIALNNTEIWSITNQSPIAHPFHIHDVQFYLLDRNGIAPGDAERGRKDVVLVKPMETVRFITRFSDHANDSVPYMFHCHMLTHEDAGMMGQFIVVDQSTTGTEDDSKRPDSFVLEQNYPNPFNPSTRISYTTPKQSRVSLKVFDTSGKAVIKLVEAELSPGSYEIEWNGLDESGNPISTGVYFCRLKAGDYSKTIKMVLLR